MTAMLIRKMKVMLFHLSHWAFSKIADMGYAVETTKMVWQNAWRGMCYDNF